jgi:hypothetical protein
VEPVDDASAERPLPTPERLSSQPEQRLDIPELDPDRFPPTEESLECGPQSFADNGVCAPCFVEVAEEADPLLLFEPVPTSAYWVYANEGFVEIDGQRETLARFVPSLAIYASLCESEALLVLGSASADGERRRNEERALTRATNLAGALRRACPRGPQVFALSLGQSAAAQDDPADRPISIVRISSLDGQSVTVPLVLEELGYVLADGGPAPELLSRRSRFPQPYSDSEGGEAALQVTKRPRRTVEVLAEGAPASCTAGDLGVDGD